MRSFIDKAGKVIDCTADHVVFCRKVLHKRYPAYLLQNIRVAGSGEYMVVETWQKSITAAQLKTIRRLYKEYGYADFYAEIWDSEYVCKINDLKNFTKVGD